MLVGQCRSLSFPGFERALAYWCQCADDARAEDRAAGLVAGRRASAVRTLDGMVDVAARLEPLEGSAFLEELARLEQVLFQADWTEARAEHGAGATESQLKRTGPQRRADAMVEMAKRSATAAGGGLRPLVTVLVGWETLHGRMCETEDGTVVTPGQVVGLLPSADVERVVFDGPSRIIDVGHKRRLYEGGIRRAVEVRDRHCQHPSGCHVPASRCHVDHILEWARGGRTTQENGRLLCPVHNRRRNGEQARPPPERPRGPLADPARYAALEAMRRRIRLCHYAAP